MPKRSIPVICLALAASLLLAPATHAATPLTIFKAHRPGLTVILWVAPHEIVHTRTSSMVYCGGGSKEQGSITSQGWSGFTVHHNGEFSRQEMESYEGSGSYFTGLSGQVRGNTARGEYRAWESRLGEEGWLPKCGTLSPRGLPMHFKAHRVHGPRWRAG